MKAIAASRGVKKVGPKEGLTIQIGNARLTWKATGIDTAYGTSLYEMDLAPGVGIPVHSHPYAEVFYVVSGHTDFLRFDMDGKEEWIRCGPGDTLVAAVNALMRSTIALSSLADLLVRRFTITRWPWINAVCLLMSTTLFLFVA
jgi:quercetin dioxygenase-like cupin family protein